MIKQNHLIMVFAVLSMASTLLAQTNPTTTTATARLVFPPAGLGSTETAEVNVVNAASNSSGGTAASCTGTVSFLNGSGATIGTATNFTLTSGQISSVRLPFSGAGLTGTRGAIRAEVQWTVTRGTPCSIEASFETFDTVTGATHTFITSGGAAGGFGH